MYKILIIDDEFIIREGIGDAFKETGIFNVTFASNGLEALDKCEKQKFDAMLIDIAMPKMDGIELLKNLYEVANDSVKIVLSAHDNFEYARYAMKYNVTEYLTKPLYPDDIQKIALKLSELIENKKEKQKQHDELLKEVEKDKDIIKNKLIQDIIYGNINKSDFDIQKDYLGEFINAKVFRVLLICIKFDKQNIAMSSKEYQVKLLETANVINQQVDNYSNAYYVNRNSNVFCIVIKDNGFDIDRFFDSIKQKLNASVCGGLGELAEDILLVKLSYREALIALKYNLSLCRESVLKISDMHINNTNTSRIYDEDMFSTNLKLYEKKQILKLFDNISQINLSKSDHLSIYTIELMLQKIATAAISELLHSDFESYRKQYENYCVIVEKLLNNIAISEKICLVKCFVLELLEILKDNSDCNNSKIIERVKVFINENYYKDISIADIAMYVNLSKNYLGYLFKQNTDMTIIEYIHRIRIMRAKELIEMSNMKVYEIASRVGYTDQHYFSMVFKKFVGVSPSEYKEMA